MGWDSSPGNIYDLDASNISFDKQFNELEIIYHKNMKSRDGIIIHQGDNRAGLGEGDDEVILINLRNLNQSSFLWVLL